MIASRNPHYHCNCELLLFDSFFIFLSYSMCSMADGCNPKVAGNTFPVIRGLQLRDKCNVLLPRIPQFYHVEIFSFIHKWRVTWSSFDQVLSDVGRVITFIRDGTRVYQIFSKLNGQRTFSLQLFLTLHLSSFVHPSCHTILFIPSSCWNKKMLL